MSPAFDVFVDSNTLSAMQPRGEQARRLQQLVDTGRISIHVSTIVEREVMGGLAQKIQISGSWDWATESHHADIMRSVAILKGAREHIQAGVREWLDRLGAVRHEPAEGHVHRVLDGYFAGHPPFEEARLKEHLPDAFILESVRSHAASAKARVILVTHDKRLGRAAASNPQITWHPDLDSLFQQIPSAPIDPGLFGGEREPWAREFCERHRQDIERAVVGQIDSGRSTLLLDELVPGRDEPCRVVDLGNASQVVLETEYAEALTEDTLSHRFQCKGRCTLEFAEDDLATRRRGDRKRVTHVQTIVDCSLAGRLYISINRAGPSNEHIELERVDVDVDQLDIIDLDIA